MNNRGITGMNLLLCVTIFFSWSASIGLVGCTEPEEPKLSNALKSQVDTVFMDLTDSLRKANDSLCDYNYPLYYQRAVDSIREVRLKEIQSILGK